MFKNRINIRILLYDAILVLSILLIGLLVNNNTLKSEPVHRNIPVSTIIAVSNNIAVPNTCFKLQVYQKTWILNKDNYNILAFNRNPFTMSLRAEINIDRFLILRQNTDRVPLFTLKYHLFPEETDAFPALG